MGIYITFGTARQYSHNALAATVDGEIAG